MGSAETLIQACLSVMSRGTATTGIRLQWISAMKIMSAHISTQAQLNVITGTTRGAMTVMLQPRTGAIMEFAGIQIQQIWVVMARLTAMTETRVPWICALIMSVFMRHMLLWSAIIRRTLHVVMVTPQLRTGVTMANAGTATQATLSVLGSRTALTGMQAPWISATGTINVFMRVSRAWNVPILKTLRAMIQTVQLMTGAIMGGAGTRPYLM